MKPHFSPNCNHSYVKRTDHLRFQKIFIKKQTHQSNDKTIIELSHRPWQIMVFCSTSSNNIFIIAMSLFQRQMEINFQTDRQTTVKLAVIYWSFFWWEGWNYSWKLAKYQLSTAKNEKITLNAQKCMCCYFAQEILCCTDISAIIVGLKVNNSKWSWWRLLLSISWDYPS